MRHTTIVNSTFEQEIAVTPGTTVIWTNPGGIFHSVVIDSLGVEATPFSAGETFAHTFASAGRFEFYCRPHPGMAGTVIVR